LFYRDCALCKVYWFDDGGVIYGPGKKPLPRQKGQEPNCAICPKYDTETKITWNGFTKKNKYYFNGYRICKSFCTLPRSGGYDKQDPETMEMFSLLDIIFSSSNKEDESVGKVLKKLIGG
jgi:hypothetical protein